LSRILFEEATALWIVTMGRWGYGGGCSPGMRKWITRCAVAAALVGIGLLVVEYQLDRPGILIGEPLPAGKVRPILVTGYDSAVLLAPDGSLWAWGGTATHLRSLFPQPTISQVPRRIGAESDWARVAGGLQHTVALKADRSLWAWGRNDEGEIGQGNFTNRYGTPTRIGTETNWTKVCAGEAHSLALKNDGSLWAWGYNDSGELGDGTTNTRAVPSMIGTNRDWRMIAANGFASFAIKSNGTLWNWGLEGTNNVLAPKQIGSGTNWQAVSTFELTFVALKTDGTLWQDSLTANLVASDSISVLPDDVTHIGRDSDWSEVYAGAFSFYARKKDGSWWVCGQNLDGQLGLGISITALPSPQRLTHSLEPWAFAPGNGTTLLLGKDGKLWTWGKRLGAAKPGAARQKILSFLTPVMWVFPAIGLPFRKDIDRTPFLLWEVPTEVRRSLGTEPKSFKDNLTTNHSAEASHE
jgi:alpha-tubulin suppressor-like RCC1 family protein